MIIGNRKKGKGNLYHAMKELSAGSGGGQGGERGGERGEGNKKEEKRDKGRMG